jgi:hypothetical protein
VRLGINMGEPRSIPRQKTHGAKVRRSVKMRMEANFEDGSKYSHRAFLDEENKIWVDSLPCKRLIDLIVGMVSEA